jgi:aminoglycoside phosphotransferase (APT) family kinase protein
MFVVTDVVISAQLVADLISAQFPAWADMPIRPVEAGGWDNRTFRLGEHMAVRLPSGQAYAAQIDKEDRWLPALARQVPVPIPEPLARGIPSDLFPWPWSVRRWLPGEPASGNRVGDFPGLARDLAGFLSRLADIDPTGGPPPGEHNFLRGAPLAVYDAQTRSAITVLDAGIDGPRAMAVWDTAAGTSWHRPAVWLHGDISLSNLLALNGRLSAVIDFGCCAVGDPACDLAIAWTAFAGPSREMFRAQVAVDDGTWARARGWALWKALITLLEGPAAAEEARIRFGWRWPVNEVIDLILEDEPQQGSSTPVSAWQRDVVTAAS